MIVAALPPRYNLYYKVPYRYRPAARLSRRVGQRDGTHASPDDWRALETCLATAYLAL